MVKSSRRRSITIISLGVLCVIALFFHVCPDYVNSRLLRAIIGNDIHAAQNWIRLGADVNAEVVHPDIGIFRTRPLEQAALNGNLDVAKLLVTKGADVDAQGQNGNTALHWRTYLDDVEFSTFLVKNGARTDIKNTSGETAIDIAGPECKKQLAVLANNQSRESADIPNNPMNNRED